MKSIAIIGAGLAGITLARQLLDCADVSVFEKSHGLGGRMATRRTGSYQFDHGAQFFTARSKPFQNLINEHVAEHHVQLWQPRVLTLDPQKKPFKREWFEPHYVAAPEMNSLCKILARGLNVILETQVANITADDQGWRLEDSTGEQLGYFDWVISTLPAPQAHELLPACFANELELSEVDFSPCFSLMLGYASAHKLNFDAAVVKNSPLGWIALNSSKQDRQSSFSLVVHSDNAWARTHLESDLEEVRLRMLEALGQLLGDAFLEPEHIAIHRWKYAKAETSCEENFLLDEPNKLAACGDWCGGSRIEDAFLSGLKLNDQLQSLWRRNA